MKIVPNINYFNKEFWAGDGNCPCKITKIIGNKCLIKWWENDEEVKYINGGIWFTKQQIIDNFQKGEYIFRKEKINPKYIEL